MGGCCTAPGEDGDEDKDGDGDEPLSPCWSFLTLAWLVGFLPLNFWVPGEQHVAQLIFATAPIEDALGALSASLGLGPRQGLNSPLGWKGRWGQLWSLVPAGRDVPALQGMQAAANSGAAAGAEMCPGPWTWRFPQPPSLAGRAVGQGGG